MNTGEMLGYTERFKEIVNSKQSDDHKAVRLATLMTDLEGAYQIPLFGKERIEAFEKVNPHVMQLYRTVSAERVL